jgi:hypothetical protein
LYLFYEGRYFIRMVKWPNMDITEMVDTEALVHGITSQVFASMRNLAKFVYLPASERTCVHERTVST